MVMIIKPETRAKDEKEIAEMIAANPKLVLKRTKNTDGTETVDINEAVDFTM